MKVTRRHLHLSAGLVMFAYILCHMLNHTLGIVSLEALEGARKIFIDPWTSVPGTVLLLVALVFHLGSALWVTYSRRSLRMPAWQWAQLILGLAIPVFILEHALATGAAAIVFDTNPTYAFVLSALWSSGWKAAIQAILLVTVWGHACFGLHHWLKFHPIYADWQGIWHAFAVAIPLASLLGFVAAGIEVRELARDPAWIGQMATELRYPGSAMIRFVENGQIIGLASYATLIALTFVLRWLRIARDRTKQGIRVTYPSGRRVLVPQGGTLLETSRAGGIPHASVCGGRGRCSTCRVLILEQSEGCMDPPNATEEKIIDRLKFPPNIRLACQVRPKGPLKMEPLLPPDVTMADALKPGQYRHGQEQVVAVMFADLRGFTQFSEGRLPFDVVFVLNRYFRTMGSVITESGGRIDKFIGDGIMALFGLEDDPQTAARNAIDAARRMTEALERMNDALKNDLPEPFRLGIGLHIGPAIIGTMGYGEAAGLTAIGDTVNTASRLEATTKTLSCQVIVSDELAEAAKCDLTAFPVSNVEVRGRSEGVCVRIISNGTALPSCAAMEKA